jgi:ParB family chromosome partitioning protein
VDEDTAMMIITDSNLKNRDKLLPSERGFAYRMQLEALKRQGKRNDFADDGKDSTSVHDGQKLNLSRDKVAEHHKIGAGTVRRYIRITYLIPELQESVNNDILSLCAGVELSYLDETSQRFVYTQLVFNSPAPPDLDKCIRIKKLFEQSGTFTEDSLSDFHFQSRGVTERVIPLINRKRLASLTIDIPLPQDDEELIRMFIDFLRERFNARGPFELITVARETFK